MYVAIDRKPENGCEIQNACDGQSGIMMRLKIVKTAAAEPEYLPSQDLNHGTRVLAYLVMPWAKSLRIVVGDSYFASVQAVHVQEWSPFHWCCQDHNEGLPNGGTEDCPV